MSKNKKIENNFIFRIFAVTILAFCYALVIKVFNKPAGLLPGGFAGLTLLIQQLCVKLFNYEPSYTLINMAFNIIPIYIGFKFIGKRFTILSCIVIVASSVFVDLIPVIKPWTDETLLYSVFGGILNGTIASIILLLGGTTGGTDFLSIYFSEQKGKDAWNYILAFNVCVLIISGIAFNFEIALYSIIYQFATTQALKMLYTRYQKSTMFIVTTKPKEIYKAINDISNHGATLLKGASLYKGTDIDVIYSVVATDEIKPVLNVIKEVDPKAFINVIKTNTLEGKFFNRPKD